MYHPSSYSGKTVFDDWLTTTYIGPVCCIKKPVGFDQYVLDALRGQKQTITLKESGCRRFLYFVVDQKFIILPVARNRVLRMFAGQSVRARLNGQFGLFERILRARFGPMVIPIGQDELEFLRGTPSKNDVGIINSKMRKYKLAK